MGEHDVHPGEQGVQLLFDSVWPIEHFRHAVSVHNSQLAAHGMHELSNNR